MRHKETLLLQCEIDVFLAFSKIFVKVVLQRVAFRACTRCFSLLLEHEGYQGRFESVSVVIVLTQ